MAIVNHDCPNCDWELDVDYAVGQAKVTCPRCGAESYVDYDAEQVGDHWHDLTTLRLLPQTKPNQTYESNT